MSLLPQPYRRQVLSFPTSKLDADRSMNSRPYVRSFLFFKSGCSRSSVTSFSTRISAALSLTRVISSGDKPCLFAVAFRALCLRQRSYALALKKTSQVMENMTRITYLFFYTCRTQQFPVNRQDHGVQTCPPTCLVPVRFQTPFIAYKLPKLR